MAESAEHRGYVKQIVSYLETIPNCCADLIEADLPNYNTRTTKVCGGYYPDVYYKDRDMMIIGEAKSERDIENTHSSNQFSSYMDELLLFHGKRYLVICCSIFALATMRNYVFRLIRKKDVQNISFLFIDSINRIFVHEL